jgi:hypothetical protein
MNFIEIDNDLYNFDLIRSIYYEKEKNKTFLEIDIEYSYALEGNRIQQIKQLIKLAKDNN